MRSDTSLSRLFFLVGILLARITIVCSQTVPNFDGNEAFGYLTRQVEMGPRNPGSPGHAALVRYLEETLKSLADEVKIQRTSILHPYNNGHLAITNIVGRFNPTARRHMLLMAHYDTRERADQDTNPMNVNKPIPGANDGASGVAVLLTIAGLLAKDRPSIGVDLLFLDAEDLGRSGEVENYSLGAKAFVPEISTYLDGDWPHFAVLLDMVGDAELTLPMEYYSTRDANHVVTKIWGIAESLGYREFLWEVGPAIYDDHVPFLEAGIPTVDIIDFDYPNTELNYWHTMADTPDKCSPQSLEVVGTVVATLIYSERP